MHRLSRAAQHLFSLELDHPMTEATHSSTDLHENAIVGKRWHVSHELPDSGETAVFDEARSELVLLNPIAGAIWNLVDGRRGIRQIVTDLLEQVEQPPSSEEALDTALAFLRNMAQRGAIEIVGDTTG